MVTISSVNAQYGNQGYDYNNGYDSYNDDRYYYDDEFDWHWDVRVRISNGIQNGQITRNEANRLYNQLENVERKEYAYQSDGVYSTWEQQEVWDDITYLNRQVGLELYDYDRTFYGFNNWGRDYRGYSRWYYQGGYDFYRFDKRGFGSIRLGYVPIPKYNGWYRNNNNRIGREHYYERSRYSNNNGRYNNPRGDDRRTYDNNRNSNDYGRNSRGGYDNNRNSQPSNDYGRGWQGNGNNNGSFENRGGRPNSSVEPNTRPQGNGNNNGGYESRGNRPNSSSVEPNTRPQGDGGNNGGFESRGNRPNSSVEPRSDTYGRGSGVDNSRSERSFPNTQESSGRTSRGERSPNIERPSRSVESAPSQERQSRGGRSENLPSDNSRSEGRGRRN